jgi:hypothetical protein
MGMCRSRGISVVLKKGNFLRKGVSRMSEETLPERIEELEEELEKIRHHVGLPSKEDDDEEDVCGEAEDDE